MTDPDNTAAKDPKTAFNKYKGRPYGETMGGFTLTAGGDLQFIEVSVMKSMTPERMKARLDGIAIGGSVSKSEGGAGTRFEVLAGKGGGHESKPWVKYRIKSILGITNFVVETAADADVDPDPAELMAKLKAGTGLSDDALGDGLSMLFGDETPETTGTTESSTGPSDDALGDGLSMLFGDESTDTTAPTPPAPPPPPLDLLAGLDMLSGTTDPPVDAELKKKSVAVIEVTQDAVNTIDNALNRFRDELLKSDDEELEAIADEFFGSGFPVIHGGHKVGFITSMMNVRQSTTVPAYKKAMGTLNERAAAYLKHIQSDPRVAVLDSKSDLPENVDPVGMASILGGAITSLTAEVSRQLSAMG